MSDPTVDITRRSLFDYYVRVTWPSGFGMEADANTRRQAEHIAQTIVAAGDPWAEKIPEVTAQYGSQSVDSGKNDLRVDGENDVVDRTVTTIRAGNYPLGATMLMGVAGMPVSIGPDAQPFEDAVRSRLGDGYTFSLVLAGSALVTRLAVEARP